MTRPRGRSLAGTRLIEAVPYGHWMTTTFLAGLTTEGMIAPLVIEGALNGELFRAYVEQQLASVLKPGSIVVMDNLSSHKVAGVKEAIEKVDASILYLPPYSPDLNPIELAFSKFKWLIKSAKERKAEALYNLCATLLNHFPAHHCRNYFKHCGYRYS